MYGHGAAPPTRTSGTVITLRVLFVIAGFLSCGLLSCLPLFRVAVLRGRWTDWLLAWISLPVAIGCLAVVGSVPESDHRGDVALALVLVLGAFSGAYFLVFDIRHHRAQPPLGPAPQQTGAYLPPQPPPQGYGYPPAPQPYQAAQHPQPPPQYTPPTPPPQRPAPARIDQVRAELDELSDYLRKHEDGR
ncbi:hypothetical protein MBT84_25240 [Streptomyces sp. MBT84]|uniref:hypothetical protein n=1 Tax=unclassified Streptomyces TaxID=2593676 RepID=UPI001C6EBF54|nr:hypothetical protein [Streptomyces sp. MBT84]MBW8702909.1 hypothetical protein [Streptomyces sp. MBT84]